MPEGGLHPVRLQRLPDHRRQYQKFAAGGKTAVVSTINGDSTYRSTKSWLTRSESDRMYRWWPSRWGRGLRGIDTKPLVGNLAAWNYFGSVDNPTNKAFVADYRAVCQSAQLPMPIRW